MTDIYVTKVLFEKNATNGLAVYDSKQALAAAVLALEEMGGDVQVFRCVPVTHEAYTERAGIDLGVIA